MAAAVVQRPEMIYDEESDILRLQLEDKPSVESVEVAEGVVLDYDDAGKLWRLRLTGRASFCVSSLPKAKAVFSRM